MISSIACSGDIAFTVIIMNRLTPSYIKCPAEWVVCSCIDLHSGPCVWTGAVSIQGDQILYLSYSRSVESALKQ